MEESSIYFDEETITVQHLIDKLEAIKDKNLPVNLSIPMDGHTDWFWIEIKDSYVVLGTS